jgi:SAM-dependent methyltransferase
MPTLQHQPTASYDSEQFERRIREYAAERPGTRLRILEAGCGRRWTLDLAGVDYHLTGLDSNEHSMRMRIDEVGDLDEAIVGDLRRAELEPEAYDVVFNSFVLEHIAGARQVLDLMVGALRPGGLLLLRIPDRDSMYGFITRHTPHRLHITYKRRIRGKKLAGTPGRGPFPTVYDRVVSYNGVIDYCASAGLVIESAYSSNHHVDFFGRLAPVVDRGLRTAAALSFGRLTADHSNLSFIIRKAA